MASQLSRNELVAISSLAASIGIPIQIPERGLLPAVLVAVIVVMAQRIVSVFARLRSQKVLHPGQVRRMYFEADGDFTVIKDPGGKAPTVTYVKIAAMKRQAMAVYFSSGLLPRKASVFVIFSSGIIFPPASAD
jgi:uncharacterized membrane protein YcaP (DUF421 family)